jgi:hypothetical protein
MNSKGLAVAQELNVSRFVLKIDGDGAVFTGLAGGVAHGSPSGQMVEASDDPRWTHAFTIRGEGVGGLPLNRVECANVAFDIRAGGGLTQDAARFLAGVGFVLRY